MGVWGERGDEEERRGNSAAAWVAVEAPTGDAAAAAASPGLLGGAREALLQWSPPKTGFVVTEYSEKLVVEK